jgi:hypothetical protein
MATLNGAKKALCNALSPQSKHQYTKLPAMLPPELKLSFS